MSVLATMGRRKFPYLKTHFRATAEHLGTSRSTYRGVSVGRPYDHLRMWRPTCLHAPLGTHYLLYAYDHTYRWPDDHSGPSSGTTGVVRVSWETEWRAVISNVSRFCLHASDGRVRVRGHTGEGVRPECVQPGYIESILSGGVGENARSPLVFEEGSLTSVGHVHRVVKLMLIPFSQLCAVPAEQCLSSHCLLYATHSPRCSKALSRSPDSFLIEHVWDLMSQPVLRLHQLCVKHGIVYPKTLFTI